ncbi:hypothetical protein L1049_027863 [Liquidambar formosana]|uniref:Uncharacterized protein n=1 Tax=Liquidambar formosana TaxID=63359 RepID=A0AAP0RJC5_LIQFO
MGNCQAIDAATLVIQHPCGRVDKLYWPVTASEIMKANPGHYVALLITTTTTTLHQSNTSDNHHHQNNETNNNTLRVTRIKLLRPTDTLALGHVYRLITTQDVMKGLWAKKYAKMKKQQQQQSEFAGKHGRVKEKTGRSELEAANQVTKHEMHRQRTPSASANAAAAAARSKTWQPSLHSILESGN